MRALEDQPSQSGLRHASEGDAGAGEGIRAGDGVWQGFLKKWDLKEGTEPQKGITRN